MKFVYLENLDDLKSKYPFVFCKICDQVLVNPILCEECEEYTCFSCIENNSFKCCDKKIIIGLFELSCDGKGIIRKILQNLKIYCTVNRENGCQWVGTRKEYPDHKNSCDQKYSWCIYGCGRKIGSDNLLHLDECETFSKWIHSELKLAGTPKDKKEILEYISYSHQKIKILQEENRLLLSQIRKTNSSIDVLNIEMEDILRIRLKADLQVFHALPENSRNHPVNLEKSIPGKFQEYTIDYTGYLFMIAIGGGAGGSGGDYPIGGSSGHIGYRLIYVDGPTTFKIYVGKGGSGFRMSKKTVQGDPYNLFSLRNNSEDNHHARSGGNSGISFNDQHFLSAPGAENVRKIPGSHLSINYGSGFCGGGYGAVYCDICTKVICECDGKTIVGGNGGSNGSNGFQFIDNKIKRHGGRGYNSSNHPNPLKYINQVFPMINAGLGGTTNCNGGGGAGGILIDNHSPPKSVTSSESEIKHDKILQSHGGEGYGAGGAAGHCYVKQIPGGNKESLEYTCYNGGDGADGCVIICQVDFY